MLAKLLLSSTTRHTTNSKDEYRGIVFSWNLKKNLKKRHKYTKQSKERIKPVCRERREGGALDERECPWKCEARGGASTASRRTRASSPVGPPLSPTALPSPSPIHPSRQSYGPDYATRRSRTLPPPPRSRTGPEPPPQMIHNLWSRWTSSATSGAPLVSSGRVRPWRGCEGERENGGLVRERRRARERRKGGFEWNERVWGLREKNMLEMTLSGSVITVMPWSRWKNARWMHGSGCKICGSNHRAH